MPPLIAVAILVGLPICLASLSTPAYASTSLQHPLQQSGPLQYDATRLSQDPYAALQRASILQTLGILPQQRNLPKSYPGLSLPRSLPSIVDLNNLESTLSNLKNKVAYLKTQRVSPDQIANLETQIQDLEDTIKLTKQALAALQTAQEALKASETDLQDAKTAYNAKVASKEQTQAALEQAQAKKASADAVLQQAQSAYAQAQAQVSTASSNLAAQLAIKEQAQARLSDANIQLAQAEQTLQQAQQTFNEAHSNFTQAQQNLNSAQQTFNEAKSNYDNNLIPDPSYTPPTYQQERTRQVPQTTTQLTGGLTTKVYDRNGYNNAPPMPYQGETPLYTTTVPNVAYDWGSSQVLNSGRQEDVIVSFTGLISPTTSGYYRFYTPADDGTKLYINNQLIIDDWYDKGGGGSVSAPIYLEANTPVPVTLYYYENGGGAAVSFYYYTPTEGYRIVPAAWLGTQTQTTTTYITETYYTTEPVVSEQTINVNITEGGQATFNAPTGSTFTSSNLRYESINNPTCGTNIYPQVNGLSSVTLQADNSIYGDPCGGQVKRITGTLTYVGPPPAPLIKNPALLPALAQAQTALTQAQEVYDDKLQTKNLSNSALAAAQTSYEDASTSQLAAEQTLQTESATFRDVQTSYEAASEVKSQAEATKAEASTSYEQASSEVAIQTESLTAVVEEVEQASQVVTAKTAEVETANQQVTKAVTTSEVTYTTATQKAAATSNEVESTTPEPDPTETPSETGSEDLPAEITADNLLTTDLSKVDPTEMTPEQADQLKEAALEVFETAEEGSEAYEQALDALYLAAEQDDIVLDPALAAIPGLAAATELVNFLGNAGADMSPKKREESQKVVVTAVVAAGAAIQSAAAAAATASGGTNRR
jgi:hypothetical protein